MTKFEELTEHAKTCALEFREMMQDLTYFARPLILGLKAYLGLETASKGMLCQEIDRQGRPVDEPSFVPTLCYSWDTFAYFDLLIEYPAPSPYPYWQRASIRIGFKKIGDEYHIHIPHLDGQTYTEFRVCRENKEAAFFQPFFEMLRTTLQRSWKEDNKPPFGFHVPSKVEKVDPEN